MTPFRIFDGFQPGVVLGTHSEAITPEQIAAWSRIYGSGPSAESEALASLILVLMLRAYMVITEPRPKGNIHARQKLLINALPSVGEAVNTRLSCLTKEMRRDRRYIEFEAIGTGNGGRPLYRAIMTAIWAA